MYLLVISGSMVTRLGENVVQIIIRGPLFLGDDDELVMEDNASYLPRVQH